MEHSRDPERPRDQGKLDEALCIYKEKVLPIYEKVGGERNRLSMMERMGELLKVQGKLDEALHIFIEVQDDQKRLGIDEDYVKREIPGLELRLRMKVRPEWGIRQIKAIDDTSEFLEDVSRRYPAFRLNSDTVQLEQFILPFYEEARLWKVIDVRFCAPFFFLRRLGCTCLLDGTNQAIYEMNRDSSIRLDRYSATFYARFFFDMIAGIHGPFVVVERLKDIPWDDDVGPEWRKRVKGLCIPLRADVDSKTDEYHMVATMLFRGDLTRTIIRISPSGDVNLGAPEFVFEDLPVRK